MKTLADHSRAYRTRKAERIARMEAALEAIVAINPAELQKDDSMALFHAFLLARDTAAKALAKTTNV